MKKEFAEYLKADGHLMRHGFKKISDIMGRELGWDTAALYEHLRSLGDFFGEELVEKDGEAWFFRENAALMAFLGVKRTGLARCIDRLVDAGLIDCVKAATKNRTHVSHYRIKTDGFAKWVEVNVGNQHLPRSKCRFSAGVNVGNQHLPGVSPLPKRDTIKNPKTTETVAARIEAAFEAYKEITGKRTALSPGRRKALKAWLATEGNDFEKLKALSLGLTRSTFNVEGHYMDISHLLRDSNEERLLALSRGGEGQGGEEAEEARAKVRALLGGAS